MFGTLFTVLLSVLVVLKPTVQQLEFRCPMANEDVHSTCCCAGMESLTTPEDHAKKGCCCKIKIVKQAPQTAQVLDDLKPNITNASLLSTFEWTQYVFAAPRHIILSDSGARAPPTGPPLYIRFCSYLI